MKIYKFRSWNEDHKCFYYFVNGGYFAESGEISHRWRFNWENAEQFTALHDKTGKEIYEDDFCKHNGTLRRGEYLLVEFKDGAFCLTAQYKKIGEDVSCTIRDLMFQAKKHKIKLELEIIGNIHENPELQKGE